MHKIFKILMLMLAATLVACGGGGGEAGTSSGATPPVLRTTAPAALIMLAGTSQEFVVEGGRAPYRVTSNNVAVGTAKIDEDPTPDRSRVPACGRACGVHGR